MCNVKTAVPIDVNLLMDNDISANTDDLHDCFTVSAFGKSALNDLSA
jgi:hypothetical protein